MAKEIKKKKWPGWLVVVLTIGGLALLGQASKSVVDLSARPTPVPAPTDEQKKNVSKLFCMPTGQYVNSNYVCIRCVNLDEANNLLNSSGKEVEVHNATGPAKQESCDTIANTCLENWDYKTCVQLAGGDIWLGMTRNQLILSRGVPKDQNNSVGNWGFHTQWVYGDSGPYIYLEGSNKDDLKVTSWQD